MEIRPLTDDDRPWVHRALAEAWGSTVVARHGVVVDAGALPGFVAVAGGRRVGLVTYSTADDAVEVVTIHVEQSGGGTGQALLGAVVDEARRSGATRLWLVTTNDNGRAIAFYERFGMELVEVIADGVRASRVVKPSIPMTGADGVEVRDELVYGLDLTGRSSGGPPR